MRTNFNGGPALLVTYTDVTQRHEAEAALRDLKAGRIVGRAVLTP